MKRELPVRIREGPGVKIPRATRLVVLCRTEAQVQEAHDPVQRHLTSLGLTLSAEKTKTTKFRDGFAFLGIAISAWSVMFITNRFIICMTACAAMREAFGALRGRRE